VSHRRRFCAALALLVVASLGRADQSPPAHDDELRADTEEILVFRTARTQHTTGATAACMDAPFPSANEDYYELWSIALRPADGRVVKTRQSKVGGFTACLGQLVKDQPLQMYATGTVAKVPWVGVGECLALMSQPPVHKLFAFTCHLNLSGLPSDYAGGFLISSTMAPLLGKDAPASAHVPGYLSTSVVTVRLWKKVPAAG
jgi:hypothetical protein